MRLLPEAAVTEARRALASDRPSRRLRLRPFGRAPRLAVLTVLLGALLGIGYVHLIAPHPDLLLEVLCGIGGACACYLLIALPQLTLTVLRRQWVRLALRLSQRRFSDWLTSAAVALEKKRTDGDQTAEDSLDQAVINCLRGEWEQAIEKLKSLYEQTHGEPEANNLLVALIETQRWDEAAALVNEQIALGRDFQDGALAHLAAHARHPKLLGTIWKYARQRRYPRTLNNLGVRFLRSGDLLRAERAFSIAIESTPTSAHLHANLGVLAYRREDYSLALREMMQAVHLEPGEGTILSNLGPVLCRTGESRIARAWLRRARMLLPTSADVLVNLGNAYAIEGRHDEAMEAETEAAHLGASPAAHHNAALLLSTHEHWEAALGEQRLAWELAPTDPQILNNLGCLLWLSGHYAESVPHFREAAKALYNLISQGNLVRAELASGELQQARSLLLQATYAEDDVTFDRGLMHLLRALYEYQADSKTPTDKAATELAEAAAEFRKIVVNNRGPVAEAHINLGIIEYLSGNYGQAAEAFAAAADLLPPGNELSYAIATCYLTEASQILEALVDGYGPAPAKVQELLAKALPYLERAIEVRKVADAAH
ncbi:MAG: tetratricopeptide repeat protein, partial [Candidatus Zipacnadales bacterium]